MITLTDELLDAIVETIVREVDPEQIILFGSRARGAARDDSDIDLLIVEREPFGPSRSRRQEMTKLWRVLARYPVSKDILIYTQDEVKRWQTSINHVIGHAMREGRVLYERP
jgi:predicted nucleotidyltransferase